MRKFQWSLGVGTEKQANAVRSDSRLMTNRRSTHLTFHLHLVKPKSWITGKPHLTRRWPFGRVTEGLPTIHPERPEPPYSGLNDSTCWHQPRILRRQIATAGRLRVLIRGKRPSRTAGLPTSCHVLRTRIAD